MRTRTGLCVAILFAFSWNACFAVDGSKVSFRNFTLDKSFRSEGVAVADFNGDGKLDIAAGNVYYTAPDWKMHPMRGEPKVFEFRGYKYSDSFACFAEDLNGDGRADLIVVDQPGVPARWYENPGSTQAVWKGHLIVPVVNNESPLYADVDGDGRRELVFGYNPDTKNPDGPERRMALARPAKDPHAPWTVQTISAAGAPGTKKYAHGLGVGDVDGDGHNEVLIRQGWWKRPADANGPEWPFHKANLGEDCSHMCVYDFDGDGDNDVLTSSAHRFGLWWHEQTPKGWKTHEIDKSFSQLHWIALADINGDGLDDFVTGKRWFAHGGNDPGADMPAVLYWFELQRADGRPKWVRHTIDEDSGVGTQFEIADVNADGLLDIAISNKKGVFHLQQERR